MSLTSTLIADYPAPLPAGFVAVPITPEQEKATVRLCVVVTNGQMAKGSNDQMRQGGGGGLVVLRELLDARVLLGAMVDGDGVVHRLLELWIQDVSGIANALPTFRDALNNTILDERWAARCSALAASSVWGGAGGRVATGWEKSHPEPMFVEMRKGGGGGGGGGSGGPVKGMDKSSGTPWVLCEDDAFLAKKGKPAFGASSSRYLYVPMLGDRSPLVAVAGPEFMGDWGAVAAAVGLSPDALPVNPSGGLMFVQALAPLTYEQFIDAMGGSGGEGTVEADVRRRASKPPSNAEVGRAVAAMNGGHGWLGPSSSAPTRRLPEVLHLKLRAFAEAVACVRAASETSPLLNVRADSFRVTLAEGGASIAGLPMWWTGRVSLADTGEAVELPIPGSTTKYFVCGSDRLSIYASGTMARSVQSRGVLQIRRVVDASLGSSGGTTGSETGLTFGTSFEGTLRTHERVSPGSSDLVWIRFSVAGIRIDTYAVPEQRPGAAGFGAAELRFKTLPAELPAGAVERLNQAAGVPIPDVMFEVLPRLSSPCDLYSLAVLGARTFLTNGDTTLPVAWDELMSLGTACASEPAPTPDPTDPTAALADIVGRVLAKEPRLLDSLGCHRLVTEKVDPAAAATMIPARLWHQLLATLLRMVPGPVWFARSKDFGDSPAGAPFRVFDHTLDSLHGLLNKTRGLLVADQPLSREVQTVVRELLARV